MLPSRKVSRKRKQHAAGATAKRQRCSEAVLAPATEVKGVALVGTKVFAPFDNGRYYNASIVAVEKKRGRRRDFVYSVKFDEDKKVRTSIPIKEIQAQLKQFPDKHLTKGATVYAWWQDPSIEEHTGYHHAVVTAAHESPSGRGGKTYDVRYTCDNVERKQVPEKELLIDVEHHPLLGKSCRFEWNDGNSSTSILHGTVVEVAVEGTCKVKYDEVSREAANRLLANTGRQVPATKHIGLDEAWGACGMSDLSPSDTFRWCAPTRGGTTTSKDVLEKAKLFDKQNKVGKRTIEPHEVSVEVATNGSREATLSSKPSPLLSVPCRYGFQFSDVPRIDVTDPETGEKVTNLRLRGEPFCVVGHWGWTQFAKNWLVPLEQEDQSKGVGAENNGDGAAQDLLDLSKPHQLDLDRMRQDIGDEEAKKYKGGLLTRKMKVKDFLDSNDQGELYWHQWQFPVSDTAAKKLCGPGKHEPLPEGILGDEYLCSYSWTDAFEYLFMGAKGTFTLLHQDLGGMVVTIAPLSGEKEVLMAHRKEGERFFGVNFDVPGRCGFSVEL